jgi:hypothetical protein
VTNPRGTARSRRLLIVAKVEVKADHNVEVVVHAYSETAHIQGGVAEEHWPCEEEATREHPADMEQVHSAYKGA